MMSQFLLKGRDFDLWVWTRQARFARSTPEAFIVNLKSTIWWNTSSFRRILYKNYYLFYSLCNTHALDHFKIKETERERRKIFISAQSAGCQNSPVFFSFLWNYTSSVLMACTLKPLEMVPLSGNIPLGNKSVERICGLGSRIYFSCTCGDKGACVISPQYFTCGCQTHHHLLFIHRVNISV